MAKFTSVEEQNKHLFDEGFASYENSFVLTFRDRKKNFFMVKYGEHGEGSQDPYFSTSCGTFNHGRSDWDSCGQSQDSTLKNSKLKSFYRKWDNLHLKVLTLSEFEDLENDLNDLKDSIPFIENDRFSNIVDFDRELS